MKRLFYFMLMAIAVVATASARDTYSRTPAVLPAAAQTALKNFKAGVSIVKIDTNGGIVRDYEVIMTDGSEIEFDASGNWTAVEVGRGKAVPAAFVPAAIQNYVKANHAKARVIGIEKDRRGYDVDLSTGVDIKFDTAGNFIRVDR